jgi:hypothetical protein
MASFGARSYASHGKLHKRNGSASSSIQSPALPPALEHFPSDYRSSGEFKRVKYTDEQWEIQSKGAPIKIRPYLRKLSSRDDNKIDLSRTTEENERIAGLGIGTDHARSVNDVSFERVNGRSRHGRTTSNGSQFSVSSLQRPTVPYGHPMRQTPRPYTPPIAKSYATSMFSDPIIDESTDVIMVDEHRPRFYSESHHRTDSVGSLPMHPPPLHIHTNNSFTRLNASQSSIPSSLPTGGRSRGDTLRSMETIGSPSSGRTSIDKAVSFLHRGKSMDELDAAQSRAASIRALRAAYNEKELAKEEKYEKEALKQAKKQAKKQDRHIRRKSDATSVRARSESNSHEKQDFVGKAYDEYNATHASSLPKVLSEKDRPRGATNTLRGSSNKGARSAWVRFLAWLRTRFLRIGGKAHGKR